MSTIKKLDCTHYGLPVYEVDGAEYAIGTDKQADKAAREYCKDSLWAFNAEWLAQYIPGEVDVKSLRQIQEKLCESANDMVKAMLGRRLNEMISDSIAADGRGHFLSPYDGNETGGEDVAPKFKGKIAFRIY